MSRVGPFWRYYGGKWRAAPRYPQPVHGRIVEPCAGAAGYACLYPHLDVTLVDPDENVAATWAYLIGASAREIAAIPPVPDGGTVDDIVGVTEDQRRLVGWWCNTGTSAPRKRLSAWQRDPGLVGINGAPKSKSWADVRDRIAVESEAIAHWKIIHGTYEDAPDVPAAWFIDPPYFHAGKYYRHGSSGIDYAKLGQWCRTRQGQVIVCEQHGASWLPFAPFGALRATSESSDEVIFYSTDEPALFAGALNRHSSR